MPSSRNNVTEDLAKSLEAATSMMQDLLGDIKGNASSLTLLRVKLESLTDNVETLSHIIRDGNGKGSLITRIALVEKSAEDIEEDLDEIKGKLEKLTEKFDNMMKAEKDDATKEKEFKRAQWLARLKVLGLVTPGVVALIVLLFKFFTGME